MIQPIEITKKSNFDFYLNFMSKANQEEFLRSQIQFRYAVESFPRALFLLGSLIQDASLRFIILENLNEEHGHGDSSKFHINTYDEYLRSLGVSETLNVFNPWVDDWVNSWLNYKCPVQLATVLSAIEFLYAPISHHFSQHLNTLNLHGPQNHYKHHSEIDWEHGQELFDLALSLNNGQYSDKQLEHIFIQSQNKMLQVFNSMIILTNTELDEIASQNVAFYYLREDFSIPHQHIDDKTVNIVSIISGGENILSIMNKGDKDIVGFDMNPYQIEVFNNKLLNQPSSHEGKFESIFKHFRERFSESDKMGMRLSLPKYYLRYIRHVCNDVFSRKNLTHIFGEDAVRFTEKDFSEHFAYVFTKRFRSNDVFGYKNLNNILVNDPMPTIQVSKTDNHLRTKEIRVLNANFFTQISFNDGRKIDYVDISNIGDWMPTPDYIDILSGIYDNLEENGKLIVRKLLGDYSLKTLLENIGYEIIEFIDTTNFYSESYIAIKRKL